jgi:hypothetical protein
MIDAQTGDILTSFDSNPVSLFMKLISILLFIKEFDLST